MPHGIHITNATSGRLRETFREYCGRNQRDSEELALATALKLAGGVRDHGYGAVDGLYQVTAALAPSEAQIEADVKRQGWKIPAYFKDGRMGRGASKMWRASAYQHRTGKKRGRPSKGDVAAREAYLGGKPTLAEMQAFVIRRRVAARLFLASGWLGAIADLGGLLPSSAAHRGALQGRSGVSKYRGGADVYRAPGLIRIAFWNVTPGIAAMEAKRGIVGPATANVERDLQIYLARKKEEDRAWLKEHGIAA
jgi:hypothetical protein